MSRGRVAALLVFTGSLVLMWRTCAPVEPQRWTAARFLEQYGQERGRGEEYVELTDGAYDLGEGRISGTGVRRAVFVPLRAPDGAADAPVRLVLRIRDPELHDEVRELELRRQAEQPLPQGTRRVDVGVTGVVRAPTFDVPLSAWTVRGDVAMLDAGEAPDAVFRTLGAIALAFVAVLSLCALLGRSPARPAPCEPGESDEVAELAVSGRPGFVAFRCPSCRAVHELSQRPAAFERGAINGLMMVIASGLAWWYAWLGLVLDDSFRHHTVRGGTCPDCGADLRARIDAARAAARAAGT